MDATRHFNLPGFLFGTFAGRVFAVHAVAEARRMACLSRRVDLNSMHVGRNDSLKNMKLRMCVFVAACTLSMASFATGTVPCKSGQNKGSQVCTPAAKNKATAKGVAKATAKTTNKAKATTRGKTSTKASARTKSGSKPRSRLKTMAGPSAAEIAQTTSELPQVPTNVDCESTQTVLQGGAAQCPALVASGGSAEPKQPEANPGAACFAALAASNASRRLASRVPFLSDSAASPEALANKGVPGRMEKEELGSVIAGYGMCVDMSASWRKAVYASAVVSALDAYWRDAQVILHELAGGKRTFGDAAGAIADKDKAYKSQIGAMEKNLQPGAARQIVKPAP